MIEKNFEQKTSKKKRFELKNKRKMKSCNQNVENGQ